MRAGMAERGLLGGERSKVSARLLGAVVIFTLIYFPIILLKKITVEQSARVCPPVSPSLPQSC